jgi:ribosomal protein S18 acetylase RimI-like enzyme
MDMSSLEQSDREIVCGWFECLLEDHLRHWKAIFRTTAPSRADAAERQWSALWEASKDSEQCILVAREKHGTAIGLLWAAAKRHEWLDCRIGEVLWVAVDAAFRNQGVGQKLMQAGEEWFGRMQVEGKRLNVSAANEHAIALYRRFGYQIVDYRMVAPGEGKGERVVRGEKTR